MTLNLLVTVDATTLDKGDRIVNPRNPTETLIVTRIFRKEGKPFRITFAGFDWQTIKPGISVAKVLTH